MGRDTKIDWCDATWNPVTGCYHGCKYCYANGIATRFAGFLPEENPDTWGFRSGGTIVELDGMQARCRKDGKVVPAHYPFGFTPTLHRYKLDEPAKWKKPQTIFVCSMADLFGEWVPDDWIYQVFEACKQAPQHRYLFLTKNYRRYCQLDEAGMLPTEENFWYGTTVTKPEDEFFWSTGHNTFLSMEPLLEPIDFVAFVPIGWVIIGAMTGPGSKAKQPKKEWVDHIASGAARDKVPVFMKGSIQELMGDDFRQEFPW